MTRRTVAGWTFVACALAACGSKKNDVPRASQTPQAATASSTAPVVPPEPPIGEPPVYDDEACAQIVLSAWADAPFAPPNVTRTEGEAAERARAILVRVERGEDIGLLAATESDHAQSRIRAGHLGTYTRALFPSVLERLVEPLFRLRVGEVGEVVQTDLGFVVVRRCAVDKMFFRHIFVRYRGAVAAPPGVTRTREEALAKAEALRAEVIAHPETFATRARAESEDNFAARGGRVGWLTRGNEDITYENAAFALERGGVSPVVETVIGFFVVRRDG
jgi:hypothetical protein